jgi:hypothetical protein
MREILCAISGSEEGIWPDTHPHHELTYSELLRVVANQREEIKRLANLRNELQEKTIQQGIKLKEVASFAEAIAVIVSRTGN